MITIEELDDTIRRLTGEHPEARPFLCDGSPIGSEVFLVGINPGTDTPFWPYWRLPSGCHKDEWIKEYLKRHGHFKTTRARIERLFDSIQPVKCLETNIFCRYSPNAASLPKDVQDTRLFDYLCKALSPAVIFIYGDPGIRHIEQIVKRSLQKNQFTTAMLNGAQIDIIAGPHLRCSAFTDPLRGWTNERIDAVGREIKRRCSVRQRNPAEASKRPT